MGQYHGDLGLHHHLRADVDGDVTGDAIDHDPHHVLHHLGLDRHLILYDLPSHPMGFGVLKRTSVDVWGKSLTQIR